MENFIIEKRNQYNLNEGSKMSICPLCSANRKKSKEKCARLNWTNGLGHCFHCGETFQLHTYKKKQVEEKINYKRPVWKNNTTLSDKMVKYWESRRISQNTLKVMKICEGIENMPLRAGGFKELNTVQFPYFRRGELINIKYRTGSKDFKMFKDGEKIPYNLDMIFGEKEIYLVEGEPDCLSVIECGIYNVFSCPNGFTDKGEINLDWLNNDIEAFDNCEKLILCTDNDKAGQRGRDEFIRRFGAHKCFIVDLSECKDANEFLCKYGKHELKNRLENYKEVPLTNVETIQDHKSELIDFFKNGMPKGYECGIEELDKNFSIILGQYTVITGIPSHGKSEVLDQMAAGYALKYGFNIAFASVENRPVYLHSAKLVRKILGKTPKIFDNEFENVVNHINEKFYNIILETYDLDSVLIKAEELIYRKGIKILVIDPYNKVRLKESIGKGINDYTNDYLLKIDRFCAKNNVHIFLVAHPTKMEKDKNTKRRDIPDLYSIKGGGEFYDMTPSGLVVHRDFEKETSEIIVAKVKFNNLGTINKKAVLKYNHSNGRLHTAIEDEFGTITDYPDNSNWLIKYTQQPEQLQFESNTNFYENDWTTEQQEESAPF